MNCRNTRSISEETALLSGFDSPPYRMGQVKGLPVDYRYYDRSDAQRALLTETLKRLLADGIKPADIIVLSRFRFQNSSAASLKDGIHFRIVETGDTVRISERVPVIRFATAQSFKGMESPVIVLCDIDQITDGEQAMLYVAMSRARSQLTIFVHERARPSIAQCVRRMLTEGWSNYA